MIRKGRLNNCLLALNVAAQKLGRTAYVTFRISLFKGIFAEVVVIVSAIIIIKKVRQLEVAKSAS